MDVFYSIDSEGARSVPLRIIIYTDETAKTAQFLFEFFNFRLATPNPEVFSYNELTVCQTTHDPKIPQLTSSFQSKMEEGICAAGTEPFFQLSYQKRWS